MQDITKVQYRQRFCTGSVGLEGPWLAWIDGFPKIKDRHPMAQYEFRTKPEENEKRAPPPYGFCPICGADGIDRERRPNGNDRCSAGQMKIITKSLISINPYVRNSVKSEHLKSFRVCRCIRCNMLEEINIESHLCFHCVKEKANNQPNTHGEGTQKRGR